MHCKFNCLARLCVTSNYTLKIIHLLNLANTFCNLLHYIYMSPDSHMKVDNFKINFFANYYFHEPTWQIIGFWPLPPTSPIRVFISNLSICLRLLCLLTFATLILQFKFCNSKLATKFWLLMLPLLGRLYEVGVCAVRSSHFSWGTMHILHSLIFVPGGSERTWTPFHHPPLLSSFICTQILQLQHLFSLKLGLF